MVDLRRRAEDNNSESAQTILARIDERLKNLNKNFNDHLINYEAYTKANDANIRGIYKTLYIGIGGLGMLQFIIMMFKH